MNVLWTSDRAALRTASRPSSARNTTSYNGKDPEVKVYIAKVSVVSIQELG